MTDTTHQPYRTGLICEAGGTTYWHTGATYWVARESEDGPQADLREFPGFADINSQFQRATAIFHDDEWSEIAEAEPAIASARDLLRDRSEALWWKLVADFLTAHHSIIRRRSEARAILSNAGMDNATIEAVLAA